MVINLCVCVFAALFPKVSRSRQAAIVTDWPGKRPKGSSIDFAVKKDSKSSIAFWNCGKAFENMARILELGLDLNSVG